MAASRIAGIISFAIDGSNYDVTNVEIEPTTVTREAKYGQTGFAGTKEMYRAGMLKATIYDSGGITVSDFNAMTDNSIQVGLANGGAFIVTNAYTVEAQNLNTMEGEFEVTWNFSDFQELAGTA